MKPRNRLAHIHSIADPSRHPVSGELMGQRKVFSPNGDRTIGYLYGKCELQLLPHIINKNEFGMDHRLTCKKLEP